MTVARRIAELRTKTCERRRRTLMVMESVFGEVVVVSAGLTRFSLPTVFVQHYDRGSGCSFSSSFIFVSLPFSSCTNSNRFSVSVTSRSRGQHAPNWCSENPGLQTRTSAILTGLSMVMLCPCWQIPW